MKLNAACTTAVLALLLAGVLTTYAQRDYKDQSMDLLRLLASKPWANGAYGRWEPRPLEMDSRIPLIPDEAYDDFKTSSKRSAVATALNSGRRRRQPTPALGVLNDVGSFFDSLRDNLETLTSLTPAQRSTLFQGPSVVNAPSTDLTTADRSWRPMVTPTQTDTIPACCGPDSGARDFPTFPHPHARNNLYRNTRDTYTVPDNDPVVDKQPRALPILFPEYFAAYENVDSPLWSDDSFEVPQRKEMAQDFYRNAHVHLDSELGRARLLEYLVYRFPRPSDEVINEESMIDNYGDDSINEFERPTHKAPCPRYRRWACNHLSPNKLPNIFK